MSLHGTYYDLGNMEIHSKSHLAVPRAAAPRKMAYDAEAYNLRGVQKAELGELESAIADFDMAISLNPGKAGIYYNRGLAKTELNQFNAAIADFDMAISLQPDFAPAYNNRGNVRATLGQLKEAIVDFDMTIENSSK